MSTAATRGFGEDYTAATERARHHAEDNGWSYYERPSGFGASRLGWHKYDDKGGSSLMGGPKGAARLNGMFDHDDRCVECGAWIEYGSAIEEHLRAVGLCSTCDFYLRHIAEFSDRHVVLERKNGERWGYHIRTIGLRSGPTDGLGHAGARFRIRFHDGREVETNDLWCWGTGIPERFHDRLPVNAESLPWAAQSR